MVQDRLAAVGVALPKMGFSIFHTSLSFCTDASFTSYPVYTVFLFYYFTASVVNKKELSRHQRKVSKSFFCSFLFYANRCLTTMRTVPNENSDQTVLLSHVHIDAASQTCSQTKYTVHSLSEPIFTRRSFHGTAHQAIAHPRIVV